MGISLMVEVLDRYHGPPRRKLWLMAFAERASDETRTGWPGRGELVKRTGVSPRNVTKIAAALITEGVIRRVGDPGVRGRATTYALAPLPEQVPEAGTSPAETGTRGGYQSARTGVQTEHNWYPPATPQPSVEPSEKGIPSGAASPAPTTAPTTARTILADFIDWDRGNGGKLTRATIGQLAREIGKMIAEGIEDGHIRRGLADWRDRGQHPSTLHSFVDAAMAPPRRSRRQAETAARHERWMAWAREADAAEAAERGEPG